MRKSHASHFFDGRYLFANWQSEPTTWNKPGKWVWKTAEVFTISRLSAMEKLKSGTHIGWGCARLINANKKKKAESAALAMPPAVATLRRRKQGDMLLMVSFHTAVVH